MKKKPIKYFLPSIIQSSLFVGKCPVIYTYYDPIEYPYEYRAQITSPITKVMKDGSFYTKNSHFIPKTLSQWRKL